MPLKGTRLPLSGERILLKYSWSWQRKTCRRADQWHAQKWEWKRSTRSSEI